MDQNGWKAGFWNWNKTHSRGPDICDRYFLDAVDAFLFRVKIHSEVFSGHLSHKRFGTWMVSYPLKLLPEIHHKKSSSTEKYHVNWTPQAETSNLSKPLIYQSNQVNTIIFRSQPLSACHSTTFNHVLNKKAELFSKNYQGLFSTIR
jgi:hypothetical protein